MKLKIKSMSKEYYLEKFLDEISSVPHWVKNEEDALKYATHLHYRLTQYKALADLFSEKLSKVLSEDVYDDFSMESRELYSFFEEAYNSSVKFKTFEDKAV